MQLKDIELSESLDGIARIGAVLMRDIVNTGISPELYRRTDDLVTELRGTVGERPVSELEVVQRNRTLHHSLGVDPTKERPSSELLLRHILKGQNLPRENKLVDLINLASLSLQCPLSVYDWDKLVPPVLVRIGRPDESYPGSGEGPTDLEGRLVLVDGEGLFGSPTHDSNRARIETRTVRALVIAWVPTQTSNEELDAVLKEVARLAADHTEAKMADTGILG